MTPKSKKKNLTPKVASATPTRSHTSTSMSMQSTNSGANREGAANHTRRSQTSVRSGTPPPPRLSQSIRSGGASAGEGTHSTTRSTRRQTSLSRGNTPRGSVNQGSVRSGTPGKQSNGRGATPNPNGSLQEMPISQLLSRLLNNTRLGDMRPDICRFDANSKEDVRYLYEVQHRAYPEFRSVTRRGNTEIANRMLRSRVFDFINEPEPPAKPPQAAKSPRALKSDDGLGALTRFIYSAEGRPVSPHGRRRCLTPSNRNAVVSDPILCKGHPLTPRLGKYRPPVRTQSNLGRDLVVSDQSAEAATPRPRIRSLSGVRTFEARQPALTIPPRRKAGICISALQDHVANKDNDIFGVRRRREYDEQQRRVRVESAARSVSPRVARSLSIEKGEETPAPVDWALYSTK
uniref:WGS project CAEQ00000000 data, annotated contig 1334 n=1 Tax=Trypanosoma congolense (strain IL3000) TaxID=1068625 RepID=F9W5J9_TRYCI|nr:unnamed protein product [Trypanosoma congolense IL3000]